MQSEFHRVFCLLQDSNRAVNGVFCPPFSLFWGEKKRGAFIVFLWWIVQWGNEYLARFKASATKKELDAHEQYKTWTQQTKQKKDAGFTASVRSAPASAPGSAQKVTPFVDSD